MLNVCRTNLKEDGMEDGRWMLCSLHDEEDEDDANDEPMETATATVTNRSQHSQPLFRYRIHRAVEQNNHNIN